MALQLIVVAFSKLFIVENNGSNELLLAVNEKLYKARAILLENSTKELQGQMSESLPVLSAVLLEHPPTVSDCNLYFIRIQNRMVIEGRGF